MPSEESRPLVNRSIFTLRFIVLGLAAGVAAYGAYAVMQNWGKPPTFLKNVEILFEVIGVVMAIAGMVLSPSLVRFDSKHRSVETFCEEAIDEIDELHGRRILSLLQMRTIAGCCLFVVGAVANLSAYARGQELAHLVVAVVLMLLVLSRFPLRAIVLARVAAAQARRRIELESL